MRRVCTLVLCALPLVFVAQSIERDVVGTAGADQTNNQVSISYTLGEPATEYLAGSNASASSGYQQPILNGIGLIEQLSNIQVDVYPNPFQEELVIDNLPNTQAGLVIYSMDGKQTLSLSSNMLEKLNIDVRSLPAGNYLLRITLANSHQPLDFKLQKTK